MHQMNVLKTKQHIKYLITIDPFAKYPPVSFEKDMLRADIMGDSNKFNVNNTDHHRFLRNVAKLLNCMRADDTKGLHVWLEYGLLWRAPPSTNLQKVKATSTP